MNELINAVEYAKSLIDRNGSEYEKNDKELTKESYEKDFFRKLLMGGIVDAEKQKKETEAKKVLNIFNNSFETKFVMFFQKFLIYSTGIAVGIIILNILYLIMLTDVNLSKVIANVIAALTMMIINERIK